MRRAGLLGVPALLSCPYSPNCLAGPSRRYRSSFSRTLRLASTAASSAECALSSLSLSVLLVVVGEPRIGFTFEGCELPCNVSGVSGEVLCSVLIISGFAHALREYSRRHPSHEAIILGPESLPRGSGLVTSSTVTSARGNRV